MRRIAICGLLAACLIAGMAQAEENGESGIPLPQEREADYVFDDTPQAEEVQHPAWFDSRVDSLPEALAKARKNGKSGGLILYFGQRFCPYCDELLRTSFARDDVATYTRKYFDVLAFDIQSDAPVTLFDGQRMSQAEFATRAQTNLTPALLFYTPEGEEILRLRGYYPPYIVLAALDFMVARRFVQETFQAYLNRASRAATPVSASGLNQDTRFIPPPYLLNTLPQSPDRLLVVFFEQADCHACDILHRELLHNPMIGNVLTRMDLVQLDARAETPLITPGGERTTAAAWAEKLGLFYMPTMLFFDHQGREVFRVDSVVRLHRLNVVLQYMLDQGYYSYPNNLQGWFFARHVWR